MSQDLSNEDGTARVLGARVRSHALTPAGWALARTLWGIERFGRPSAAEPPPVHTDFAWQLQTDHALRQALREALDQLSQETPPEPITSGGAPRIYYAGNG